MSDAETRTKDLTQIFDTPSTDAGQQPPELDLSVGESPAPDVVGVDAFSLEVPAAISSGELPASEPIGTPEVEAAYPFHLTIEGHLTSHEKTRLLEWIKANDVGIRDTELEPQFEAGRILLPRLSEYVGIALIQQLKASSAHMKLEPSPTEADDLRWQSSFSGSAGSASGVAEFELPTLLPVLHESTPPGTTADQMEIIGLITQSVFIKSETTHIPQPKHFQRELESLMAHLAMRAQIKQATHVVNFGFDLAPMDSLTEYRLTARGTAVRIIK